MEKEIVLTLTESEALGLLMAASNILDHEDAIEAVFPDEDKAETALRAYHKLGHAYQSA